jgi:YVTN family beta-propeller protein
MLVDPYHPLLYLTNSSGNSLAVINTSDDKVLATIWMGAGPSGIAISANGQQLYVAVSHSDYLAIINLTSLTVAGTIQLSASPTDVAAGRQGRAYVTTASELIVIDTSRREVIGQVQDYGSDLAEISPNKEFLYTGETGMSPATLYRYWVGTDNISLISQTPSNTIAENLRAFVISPDGSRLYVASGYPYYIQVLNSSSWSSIGSLDTGAYPTSVSLDAAGGLAIASAPPYDGATVFNTTTFLPVGTFLRGNSNDAPTLVALSNDGSKAFVVAGEYAFGPYGLSALNTNVTDNKPIPTQPSETEVPTWPSGSFHSASNVNSSSLSLNWSDATDVAGVSAYRLYEGTKLLATVDSSIHSYIVSGLDPDTAYDFSVQAGNFAGNWSVSGPITQVMTLPAKTTMAPETTESSSTKSSRQTTSWTASSSAPTSSASAPWGEYAIAVAIVIAGAIIALAISSRPRQIGQSR